MTQANEQNLLTKIILGIPTEDDFFAVSREYGVIYTVLNYQKNSTLLKEFNIVLGENYNNSMKALELYISYNIKSPDATIAIITCTQNKPADLYRVTCFKR